MSYVSVSVAAGTSIPACGCYDRKYDPDTGSHLDTADTLQYPHQLLQAVSYTMYSIVSCLVFSHNTLHKYTA